MLIIGYFSVHCNTICMSLSSFCVTLNRILCILHCCYEHNRSSKATFIITTYYLLSSLKCTKNRFRPLDPTGYLPQTTWLELERYIFFFLSSQQHRRLDLGAFGASFPTARPSMIDRCCFCIFKHFLE